MEEQIIYSRFRRACGVAIVLLSLTVPAAHAQSPTSEVRGVVVDHAGVPLVRAGVMVRNTNTNAQRETTTDAAGRFAVQGLPVGWYEVTASQPGLATRRQETLRLRLGETVSLRLELRPAIAADTLTIGGVLPPIDPARTAASGHIDAEVIANLPSPTRDALDVVPFVPGATRDLYFEGFSFNGQPAGLNNLVVDGADTPFPLVGRPLQYSQDAIRGIVVNANAYSAKYGRATGGVIGVTTKSGGNRFSGSAFDYFRNRQFGGTLGGPITTDRHFFFASYEGQRYDETLDDGFPWQRDQDTFFVRTDHALTGSQRLTLRYNDHDYRSAVVDADARSFVGIYSGAFGPNIVNEARLQSARDSDVISFPGSEPVTRLQGADTLMVVAGAHTLEMGVDVLRDGFSTTAFDVDATNLSLFAQDEWRVAPELTASAGVRYDYQSLSDTALFGEGTGKAAPRLGVAWSPAGSRYVVRGGYGWFYGRRFQTVAVPPLDEEPRSQQASVGVDYDWMRHTSISASYLFAAGNELLGNSRYHGMTVDLHRRFAQQSYYRFAYTLGTVDHDGRASLNDVRHRITAAAIYDTTLLAARFGGLLEDILTDWTASIVWVIQTGQPEVDAAGGFTGERRLPRQAAFSPRFARHIGLGGTRDVTLLWEIFNLSDNPNYVTGSLIEGRVMQFAARFSF